MGQFKCTGLSGYAVYGNIYREQHIHFFCINRISLHLVDECKFNVVGMKEAQS